MPQFCQTFDCMADAQVYVCSSAGWFGPHCEVCAGQVVEHSVQQISNGGFVVVVFPLTDGGFRGVNHILSLAGVEGIHGQA